uniref:Uncharacterized protein n=1 Tax=Pseudothermotoga hypogea TaxID=57487 RepID=A0A832IEJ4_9THEM
METVEHCSTCRNTASYLSGARKSRNLLARKTSRLQLRKHIEKRETLTRIVSYLTPAPRSGPRRLHNL